MDTRSLLRNANAAAAALDDAAEHTKMAAASLRQAIARSGPGAGGSCDAMRKAVEEMEKFAGILSASANTVSAASIYIVNGRELPVILPKLQGFSRDVQKQISAAITALSAVRDLVVSERTGSVGTGPHTSPSVPSPPGSEAG